jgi:predicted peptidase
MTETAARGSTRSETMGELPHLIYVPASQEGGKSAPLILFLHGSGERGSELERVKLWSPFLYLDEGHSLPAFLVAPQCPLDVRWGNLLEALDRLLDDLLRQYPVDADRVLLTGFSMGGFGVWQWAQRRPERFAALMPVAGNGFRLRDYGISRDFRSLKDTPIWMIHGAQDEVIQIDGADEFHQALRECGAHFGYTRYPHAGHTRTAELAFADSAHYDWLLEQKRQGKP